MHECAVGSEHRWEGGSNKEHKAANTQISALPQRPEYQINVSSVLIITTPSSWSGINKKSQEIYSNWTMFLNNVGWSWRKITQPPIEFYWFLSSCQQREGPSPRSPQKIISALVPVRTVGFFSYGSESYDVDLTGFKHQLFGLDSIWCWINVSEIVVVKQAELLYPKIPNPSLKWNRCCFHLVCSFIVVNSAFR